MALLDTLLPSELLGFFVELLETESEEKLWDMYLATLLMSDLSFEGFKSKLTKGKSKKLKEPEYTDEELYAKAENILKMTNFKEVSSIDNLGV